MTGLYKTTIVIWTEEDPMKRYEDMADLAREAISGEAYCSSMEAKYVENPSLDPDLGETEFFCFGTDCPVHGRDHTEHYEYQEDAENDG